METATVTMSLEDFDRMRESDKKYNDLNAGLMNFVEYLRTHDKPLDKPSGNFRFWLQRYNDTNPQFKLPIKFS